MAIQWEFILHKYEQSKRHDQVEGQWGKNFRQALDKGREMICNKLLSNDSLYDEDRECMAIPKGRLVKRFREKKGPLFYEKDNYIIKISLSRERGRKANLVVAVGPAVKRKVVYKTLSAALFHLLKAVPKNFQIQLQCYRINPDPYQEIDHGGRLDDPEEFYGKKWGTDKVNRYLEMEEEEREKLETHSPLMKCELLCDKAEKNLARSLSEHRGSPVTLDEEKEMPCRI